MRKHNIAHLSVVYLTNPEVIQLAERSYSSIPKPIFKLAVINANPLHFDLQNCVTEAIENAENCLSLAWNRGIRRLKELNYEYVLATNLDVILNKSVIAAMYRLLKKNPHFGLVSAESIEDIDKYQKICPTKDIPPRFCPIEHGDGSFSCFLLSIKAFDVVGDFDTNFKPAYFEDNDYLERLWTCGYIPQRLTNQFYFHFLQGTLKTCSKTQQSYPMFMQRNLEYFQQKHGKIPDHLPNDVSFSALLHNKAIKP